MRNLHKAVETDAEGRVRISIGGMIDEDADFEDVFGDYDAEVIVDVGEVRQMNSMGVHTWIKAFCPFSGRHRVTVHRCPYPMALQANCISNFFGEAVIGSCMGPYYCPSCKENQLLLVTGADLAGALTGPPHKLCERCESGLEFDELDNYFVFFRARAGQP